MPAKERTTPEQKAFLESFGDSYIESQKAQSLSTFWPDMFKGYFEKWPVVLPVGQEDNALREAILKEQAALKTWFRYHYKRKNKTTGVKPFVPIKNGRCTQFIHYYCAKNYKDKIQPLVLAAGKGLKLKRGEFLGKLRQISTKCYEAETPEMKTQLLKEYEAYKEAKRVSHLATLEEETSPARFAEGIQEIAYHFMQWCEQMSLRTGWLFTLLAGGPDPINGGRIGTTAVHHGRNSAGKPFSKSMVDFQGQVIAPFTSFLHTVYSQEDCEARALNQPCGSTLSNDVPSSSSQAPRSSAPVFPAGADATGSTNVQDTAQPLPIPQSVPRTTNPNPVNGANDDDNDPSLPIDTLVSSFDFSWTDEGEQSLTQQLHDALAFANNPLPDDLFTFDTPTPVPGTPSLGSTSALPNNLTAEVPITPDVPNLLPGLSPMGLTPASPPRETPSTVLGNDAILPPNETETQTQPGDPSNEPVRQLDDTTAAVPKKGSRKRVTEVNPDLIVRGKRSRKANVRKEVETLTRG
ncbi:hypothetical protein ONZ45_g9098 [Pleurotus djamor]|nr:hypothetical protein ONZ45_g9098 [Pleurotus djamor]